MEMHRRRRTEGRRPCENRGKKWRDAVISQVPRSLASNLQTLGRKHGSGFPSEPSERAGPYQDLHFRLSACRMSIVLSHPVVVPYASSPRKLIKEQTNGGKKWVDSVSFLPDHYLQEIDVYVKGFLYQMCLILTA